MTWNAEAALYERLEQRRADFAKLSSELNPDVLVLVEVAGKEELERIVEYLGWNESHAAISDFSTAHPVVFFGLEVAVVSKIPIERVIEYDASPERGPHVLGDDQAKVSEKKLPDAGLAPLSPLGRYDRGTLRVDLANGLTILPVHLKSNRNDYCSSVSEAIDNTRSAGVTVPEALRRALEGTPPGASESAIENAEKRERVIAAIASVTDEVPGDRTPVIAGDFNTSFEAELVGTDLEADCPLQGITCEKEPLPNGACSGDGYDDTFAILTNGLAGNREWTVLTKDLGRTYEDTAFADNAIDHVVVPNENASSFSSPEKIEETYGSDHYPIVTTFTKSAQ
ncbi:endonuclease/exonuclease/phosphatase family protein [Fulvimarina sp. MAC8]|uniref:endonuclease/exonuclease/phosphatase family protein n=1 Tax=Fulvimarina sp. MAC8 TaxID=3162874 RepID=UPI0032EC7D13